MKEITVISGKGGTGKTSLVGSFAALASGAVFADCDVDAANLSLIMRPRLKETTVFKASREAFILSDKCNKCGLCRELCRFGAITEDFRVDPLSCEGCGVCFYACPEKAISYEEVISGHWFVSDTPYGPLVHAKLGVAEENSGKLVTTVRNKAREIAEEENKKLILTDGPPGIGCPVIASLANSSLALIVTEPTLSGIHDMERVIKVCSHFRVQPCVCINRYDLDEGNAREIEKYCSQNKVPIAGKIPFDKLVTESMVQGVLVVEFTDSPVSRSIVKTWKYLKNNL